MIASANNSRPMFWERLFCKARAEHMNFPEKVRWHMKHDRGDLIPQLQDKYRVKQVVKESGLKSAALLHVTTDPTTIPFDLLPADFFLKANHGCGWNVVQRDGKLYHFGDGQHLLDNNGKFLPNNQISSFLISRYDCIKKCQRWLKTKYSKKEPSYHRIAPCILIEEILSPSEPGEELFDYRFYTFSGKVMAISVGSPSYRRRGQNIFLTPEWKEIPLSVYKERLPETPPLKPSRLDEMISHAERLGADLNFVRVDLYNTSCGVVFGELTFYPQAGGHNTPTACPIFNQWLGNFWKVKVR